MEFNEHERSVTLSNDADTSVYTEENQALLKTLAGKKEAEVEEVDDIEDEVEEEVEDEELEDGEEYEEDEDEESDEEELEDGEEYEEEEDDGEEEEEAATVDDAFNALKESGEMTDEIMGMFEEAGVSKELVAHVQELEDFKAQSAIKDIRGIVGSDEDYEAFTAWASEKLSEAEVTTFDNIMATGTIEEMKFAITNLKARMSNTKKRKGSNLIKADNLSKANSRYKSESDMLRDIGDKRYHTDESFREKVIAKINRSNT